MPGDRQWKESPKAPSLGDHLGCADTSLCFLQSGGSDSSQWATNPVSRQPGAHLWHGVTACLWAACVDVPEMCYPCQHSTAEVKGDLCRSSCPSPCSRQGQHQPGTQGCLLLEILNIYCQYRELDKHTGGATAAVALCTVLDIVSAAAAVTKWKGGVVYKLWQFSPELHFSLPLSHHRAIFRKIQLYESNLCFLLNWVMPVSS